MRAVTNTTPLNYLVLIEAVSVLPDLFEQILVPDVVVSQLQHERTPGPVRAWAARPPEWLQVVTVAPCDDPGLARLQAGEQEAILLAEQSGADLFIVDERAATREATRRGLSTVGTIGLLDRAAELGLLDFAAAVARLRQTTFRMTDALLEPLLDRHRRASGPTFHSRDPL